MKKPTKKSTKMKKSMEPSPVSTPRHHLSLPHLPDNALDEILSRLCCVRAAVRTSILCKSLRHQWRSIPELHICHVSPSHVSRLLLHHSAPLRLFSSKYLGTSDDDAHHPDRWLSTISVLSSSTLRTLVLHSQQTLDLVTLRLFPNLEQIELTECGLAFPSHPPRNPNLRILRLLAPRKVEGDWENVSAFISGCPLLESLEMVYMIGVSFSLDIAAPNLRELHLFQLEVDELDISGAPLLEKAYICRSFFNGKELGYEEEADEIDEYCSESDGGGDNDRESRDDGGDGRDNRHVDEDSSDFDFGEDDDEDDDLENLKVYHAEGYYEYNIGGGYTDDDDDHHDHENHSSDDYIDDDDEEEEEEVNDDDDSDENDDDDDDDDDDDVDKKNDEVDDADHDCKVFKFFEGLASTKQLKLDQNILKVLTDKVLY